MQATTFNQGLERRLRKDWVNVSGELAQGRRDWDVPTRDAAYSIGHFFIQPASINICLCWQLEFQISSQSKEPFAARRT